MTLIDEDLLALTRRTKSTRSLAFYCFLTNRSFRAIYLYRKKRHHFQNANAIRYRFWKILNFILIANFDIADSTDILGGLRVIHAFAIAIGGGRIGRGCIIHQCVTIGANYRMDEEGRQYPIIGDNVRISPGAVILGPITVGSNVIIGANSVVIKDVPDDCVVVGVPARVIAKYDFRRFG